MLEATEEFRQAAAELGIAFEPGDVARLGRYLELLLEANTRFNLTAIIDPGEAWMRHVYDSLTLMPLIVGAEAQMVIDVGSGGGVPGVPLAIVMPEVRFTLLEATGKKATFLREAASELDLTNVAVVHERAETAGQDRAHFRERFDMAVSRAVGRLRTLIELTSPFVRAGGMVLAIKGEQAAQEVAEAAEALRRLRCGVLELQRTRTGTIVLLEKEQLTPRIYPRRPGEPKRAPL